MLKLQNKGLSAAWGPSEKRILDRPYPQKTEIKTRGVAQQTRAGRKGNAGHFRRAPPQGIARLTCWPVGLRPPTLRYPASSSGERPERGIGAVVFD
jgi:hypothetical protein